MAKLVKAKEPFPGYKLLLKRISAIENNLNMHKKAQNKDTEKRSTHDAVSPKRVENNTVKRIKDEIKKGANGVHSLDLVDYKFYMANRHRF